MFTIRKKITFEMAHRLMSSYSKECQAVHGHSYTAEVFIQSESVNKDGMVIDFKVLKEIMARHIYNRFDHSLVICEKDESLHLWRAHTKKLVVVPYNPTAELMAKDICDSIYREVQQSAPGAEGVWVRLHETDTGWADYSRGISF